MGGEPTNCGQLEKENYQTDQKQREALAQPRANSLFVTAVWTGGGRRFRQSLSASR
jgi:hypothetical protein